MIVHRYFGFMRYNFSPVNMLHLLSVPDDKSWKAEAEIDKELFHQVKCDCSCVIFVLND